MSRKKAKRAPLRTQVESRLVDIASRDSMVASDPPSYLPLHAGRPAGDLAKEPPAPPPDTPDSLKVDLASRASFPASDPPGYLPLHVGAPANDNGGAMARPAPRARRISAKDRARRGT